MSRADTIFCLYLDARPRLAAQLRSLLLAAVSGGFEERSLKSGVRFVLYAASEPELAELTQTVRGALGPFGDSPDLRWAREVRNDDWRDRWTHHLGEQALTETMKIVPEPDTTSSTPSVAGQRDGVMRLLQRSAFGFGEHPTTRLIAQRLERICTTRSDLTVLDVGTGTGVLAILAALRGVERVYGIDTEPSSVAVARVNAILNGVEQRCRFDDCPVERVSERFELVVANIDAPILLQLAAPIARSVADGGQLLLSGMLAVRGPELQHAYEAEGLLTSASEIEGDWLLLELGREAR